MLSLNEYKSSDDDSEKKHIYHYESAPKMDLFTFMPYSSHEKELRLNLPFVQMFSPISGPLPHGEYDRNKHFQFGKDNPAGQVSKFNMGKFDFERQYHTINNYDHGLDPNSYLKRSQETYFRKKVTQIKQKIGFDVFLSSKCMNKKKKKLQQKRKRQGDPGNLNSWKGPWASQEETNDSKKKEETFKTELEKNKEQWKLDHPDEKTVEKLDSDVDGQLIKQIRQKNTEKKNESSEFHLDQEKDYLGRSFMYFSQKNKFKDSKDKRCFIPKKPIHTWRGHSDGVNCLQWFPKTGHMLLSGSMDKTIRLWDVNDHKKCIRTFRGHSRGIRNLYFNNNGTRFISTAYDKWIKIWDTETGQVISRHTSGKQSADSKFYPKNENEFICGQSNKVIVNWDIREDKIIQTYNDHLDSVNTVTFIDDDRRFVSTSSDKKILIWDYGTPVVCHHINEPTLHSVPFMTIHPNGKFMVGQSMDNQLVVYGAVGRFKPNKKKFRGHISAGYACQCEFSPDGRFLMSGDGNGRVFFYDWLTTRMFKKLNAHDKVCLGCVWHPIEPSKVATCSWDTTIKFWE